MTNNQNEIVNMEIESFTSGPFETIGYLISDSTGEALIIDAPMESTQLFMHSIHKKHLKVKAIVLTHTHWDHTADAAELRRQTGAKLYVHKDDTFRVVDPMKFTIMRLPFDLEGAVPDVELHGGEILEIGNMKFDVIHTPGHTEGGICLVENTQKVIFSGDTLFCGSIGRCDLPGGSMSELIQSIKEKLMVFPDETKIYCGHGPITGVGIEKISNPFLIN